MTISATDIRFDDAQMWVMLEDGRTLGVPLAWFPRLARASAAERQAVTISPMGLHWEALDEDISIAGLMVGRRDAADKGKRTSADFYHRTQGSLPIRAAYKEAQMAKKPEQTSKSVASKAAKLLGNPKTPPSVKSVAASTLTQAPNKKRK
ncbi:MAG: DUF2442 domain-containing protein [Methylobacterium sp.]|nr:DUF2442 domain-containing protein [Methylobacterium sp.]